MNNEDLEKFAARENNNYESKSTRAGAKPKYTEILAHNICNHVSNGNTLKASAAAVAISESTVHRWRKEKPEFEQMINQALAVSEARLVQKISQSEDWRAALAILERRFPETWAKRDKIDMNVTRSEGIEEVKKMIEQTDHILQIERTSNEESEKS